MEDTAGGAAAMLQAFEDNTIFQTTADDHLAPSGPKTRDQAQNIDATANSYSDPQPHHGLVPAALAKLVPRSRAASQCGVMMMMTLKEVRPTVVRGLALQA